jgi:hypothetical protein
MKTKLFCLLALATSLRLFAAPPDPSPPAEALQWDAASRKCVPKPGEVSASYEFTATNVSKEDVSINALKTSCGCTVAQLPSTPYKLAPGSNVTINVSMNFAGKSGLITKRVTVESTAGSKDLLVSADIPAEKKAETK